jgi:hypothetical protein
MKSRGGIDEAIFSHCRRHAAVPRNDGLVEKANPQRSAAARHGSWQAAAPQAAILALAIVIVAAGGCATPPPAPGVAVERALPDDFPEADYLAALRRGETVYRIDPTRSAVLVYAWRGGRLASLGHDHVIAARELYGYALASRLEPLRGRADLSVRLDRLQVDEPEARAQAGLATRPSEEDIAGTRRNMLEKVLEASRFPFARLRIEADGARLGEGGGEVMLAVELTLHGVTRRFAVPAVIESIGEDIVASGAFALKQTDFGMTPYSVLGGALKVEDRLDLRFRIYAVRLAAGDVAAQH